MRCGETTERSNAGEDEASPEELEPEQGTSAAVTHALLEFEEVAAIAAVEHLRQLLGSRGLRSPCEDQQGEVSSVAMLAGPHLRDVERLRAGSCAVREPAARIPNPFDQEGGKWAFSWTAFT